MTGASLSLGPFSRFAGHIQLPGSKSLSNRLLLLAALAQTATRLEGFLESQDTAHLRQALGLLGWRISPLQGSTISLEGRNQEFPRQATLFLGNAGTAVRPLTAVLTTFAGEWTVTGEPRMHERPIGPLVEALRQLGADIQYLGETGFPPLRIRGGLLRGGSARVDATLSSQFVTALLMAAPLAAGPVEITTTGEEVSLSYIDMTIRQMEIFGVKVQQQGRTFLILPQTYRSPGLLRVEGDATAASYFLGGGAIRGGPVRVVGAGQGSCQGEMAFAGVLESMGASLQWGEDWVEIRGGRLRGVDVDLRDLPDSAMTLATVALFAEGPTIIRGVANWRVKETDRQAALMHELTKVGARVEALPDGIQVYPPTRLKDAEIETYGDHRMAMCFALASLGSRPTILDPGCVAKTFPNFFQEWQSLAG